MTDLDPLLREVMARVKDPVGARPSLTDVRRRARRHNRRRMAATAGALACAGVATTAVIIRRDAADPSARGVPGDATTSPESAASTTYLPGFGASTTTVYGAPEMTITAPRVWDALWNARYDPAGAALAIAPVDQAAADVMPTADQFGCSTDECRTMYNYVVWHEIAHQLGFSDVRELQAANPAIDFSQPPHEGDVLQSVFSASVAPSSTTTTTDGGVVAGYPASTVLVIDGGAPAGALDDALMRIGSYNPRVISANGRSFGDSMVMPINDRNYVAQSVASLLGIGGFDTWDPSLFGESTADVAAAVVIGPDYFDRVQFAPLPTTTTPMTTTTSLG